MLAKAHEEAVVAAIQTILPNHDVIRGQIAGPATLVDVTDAKSLLGMA
jgi:hypothetical protein